jgi:hypothetical protein
MASLSEYFSLNRYKPKFEFGTRIYAKWNKIPFVGTVYNDTVVSELEGPKLSIQLDLPLMFKEKVYTRLSVPVDSVKEIKVIKELL